MEKILNSCGDTWRYLYNSRSFANGVYLLSGGVIFAATGGLLWATGLPAAFKSVSLVFDREKYRREKGDGYTLVGEGANADFDLNHTRSLRSSYLDQCEGGIDCDVGDITTGDETVVGLLFLPIALGLAALQFKVTHRFIMPVTMFAIAMAMAHGDQNENVTAQPDSESRTRVEQRASASQEPQNVPKYRLNL